MPSSSDTKGSLRTSSFAFAISFSLTSISSRRIGVRGCAFDSISAAALARRFCPSGSGTSAAQSFFSAGQPFSGGLSGVALNAHSIAEVVVRP